MPKEVSKGKRKSLTERQNTSLTARPTRRSSLNKSLTSTPVTNTVVEERPRLQRDSAKKAINYFVSSTKKPPSLYQREKSKISQMNADEKAEYYERTTQRYEAAKLMGQEMKLLKEAASKKRSRSSLSPQPVKSDAVEDDSSVGKKARSETLKPKKTKEKKKSSNQAVVDKATNDEDEDILSLTINKRKEDDDSRFSFSQDTLPSSPIDLSLEITEDQYNITKSVSIVIDSSYASQSLVWTIVKASIEVKEFIHIKIVDLAAGRVNSDFEKLIRDNVSKLEKEVLVYYYHGLDKIDKTFLSSPVVYSFISDQHNTNKTYSDLEQILFALSEQYARSFVFLAPLSYQNIRAYHHLSTIRNEIQVVEAIVINDGERMFIAYEKNNEAFYNQVRPVLDSLVVDQCQDVLTKEPGFPSVLVKLYEGMKAKRPVLKTLLGNCVKIDQAGNKKNEHVETLKERLNQEYEQWIKPILLAEKTKRLDITI